MPVLFTLFHLQTAIVFDIKIIGFILSFVNYILTDLKM